MTQLILADDHELFLEGLKGLLNKASDIELVATARDGQEVVELAEKLRPRVVLMDVTMPRLNGIQATQMILERCPDTAVITLSMHGDRRFIAESLKAGSRGYILKESTSQELIEAVRIVAAGGMYFSPKAAEVLAQDYLRLLAAEESSQSTPLSDRELEVLKLLAQGRNSKQIADRLSISKNTVDSHRRHILDKLNCESLADLTRYAIREGLLDLS